MVKHYTPQEKEKAREILLKTSSDRMQQHVYYFIAYIASLYSIYQLIDPLIWFKIQEFVGLISLWFFVYSFGRFIYWTIYYNYSMIVSPVERESEDKNYDRNCIWGIHESIGDRIDCKNYFEGYDRSLKVTFSSLFSGLKSSLTWSFIISLIGYCILTLIYNYISIYLL